MGLRMYSFIDVMIVCLNYVRSVSLNGAAFNPSWHLTAVGAVSSAVAGGGFGSPVAELFSLGIVGRYELSKRQMVRWGHCVAHTHPNALCNSPDRAKCVSCGSAGDSLNHSCSHYPCRHHFYSTDKMAISDCIRGGHVVPAVGSVVSDFSYSIGS